MVIGGDIKEEDQDARNSEMRITASNEEDITANSEWEESKEPDQSENYVKMSVVGELSGKTQRQCLCGDTRCAELMKAIKKLMPGRWAYFCLPSEPKHLDYTPKYNQATARKRKSHRREAFLRHLGPEAQERAENDPDAAKKSKLLFASVHIHPRVFKLCKSKPTQRNQTLTLPARVPRWLGLELNQLGFKFSPQDEIPEGGGDFAPVPNNPLNLADVEISSRKEMGKDDSTETSDNDSIVTPQNTTERVYYAVRCGRSIKDCVFFRWEECSSQLEDFDGAEFDVFDDMLKAEKYIEEGKKRRKRKRSERKSEEQETASMKKQKVADEAQKQLQVEKSNGNRFFPMVSPKGTMLLQCNDIVCSASISYGPNFDEHPGIIRHHQLCQEKTQMYCKTSEQEQHLISEEIVDAILNQDPPGRFVRIDAGSGFLFELNKQEAIKYTRQILLKCPKRMRPLWEDRFEQLIEFKKQFGHVNVPYSKTGLGKWVSKQREVSRKFRQGNDFGEQKEREKKLIALGFEFNPMGKPNTAGGTEPGKEITSDRMSIK